MKMSNARLINYQKENHTQLCPLMAQVEVFIYFSGMNIYIYMSAWNNLSYIKVFGEWLMNKSG